MRSVCTGANGSIASGSRARLPYWTTRMPAMPTNAWAIMPSAGDRRGSDGTAGTSYSERAKPAASRAERWGRLPTPVDAPARSDVKAGTPRASGRDVVTGRGCGPSGGPTSITRSSLTDRLARSGNLVTQILDIGSVTIRGSNGSAAVTSCRLALEVSGERAWCHVGLFVRETTSPTLVPRTKPASVPSAIGRGSLRIPQLGAQMHCCDDGRPDTCDDGATGGSAALQELTTVTTERSTRHSTHGSVTRPRYENESDQIATLALGRCRRRRQG